MLSWSVCPFRRTVVGFAALCCRTVLPGVPVKPSLWSSLLCAHRLLQQDDGQVTFNNAWLPCDGRKAKLTDVIDAKAVTVFRLWWNGSRSINGPVFSAQPVILATLRKLQSSFYYVLYIGNPSHVYMCTWLSPSTHLDRED